MEELQDDLRVNQQLTGFCTHPNAEIRFSTIDEEPVNVRQYDLPYMHRSTVTDQIRSWLDNGIIERCSNNNASNNPLLVVPKRDLTGKIKAWRTCIDPRLINKKIIDSTYPLPKARYIFDRLAGMKVFTVIDLKSGFNQIKGYINSLVPHSGLRIFPKIFKESWIISLRTLTLQRCT